MFTRQDYMSNRCDYSTYYGQFVNAAVKALVKRHIGYDNIIRSKDQIYFNDIPLRLWDVLSYAVMNAVGTTQLKTAGESRSLQTGVSIAKMAAQHLVTESREAVEA